MDKKLGIIQLPEELYEIIVTKSNYDNKIELEKPQDYDIEKYNLKNYLTQFNRLIDPLIMSMFYGLYKSKKLPPESQEDIQLSHNWEFSANISTHVNIFDHLLFCLWIKENGFPNENGNILDYRKKLYKFIERIIDQRYFLNVIMPFYLKEASILDNDTSFIYKIMESGYLKWESNVTAPEYISMEFCSLQETFIEEIINPIYNNIPKK